MNSPSLVFPFDLRTMLEKVANDHRAWLPTFCHKFLPIKEKVWVHMVEPINAYINILNKEKKILLKDTKILYTVY